jgi:hypothetical protein
MNEHTQRQKRAYLEMHKNTTQVLSSLQDNEGFHANE